MSKNYTNVPGRLHNVALDAQGNPQELAGANEILDDNLGKDQETINGEVAAALGNGGSVDSRISAAKAELKGNATSACDTLGEAETLISTEATRSRAAEQLLQEQYNALTQSDIIVGALPASGTKNKIYRVPGTTSYSDYMWNGSSFIKMAEYDNAIDEEPTVGSDNLVKSKGVHKMISDLTKYQFEDKFSIGDERGFNILDIDSQGNIKTKNFDSKKIPLSEANMKDLSISDDNGNSIVDFENGHIKTKNFDSGNFDSKKIPLSEANMKDLSISDDNGNSIVDFENGHIKTKNFDSEQLENMPSSGLIVVPENEIPVYIVCNDLDKSNSWGIGTRNKSVNIYLDHFFNTNKEVRLYFSNKSAYKTITQKIVGTGSNKGYNNKQSKYEYTLNETLSNGDVLKFKVRSVLNSVTNEVFPKVLQIGDSVTEGWFANYPIIEGAPVQSYSWAKYYFAKDKSEKGNGYDSLFVGNKNRTVFNYDGVSGTSFASGHSGKSAKWIVTDPASPFYTPNGFSLRSYLNKYKTLADDGTTRLIVGSTAGTEVTNVDAWDLCTPNIVVLQLGMNDNIEEWKTYISQIINSIKSEYPAMNIIVSVLDGCTCNYPSLYPNYQGIFFDNYNNDHTKLMEAYSWAIDNIQSENNNIYVLYSGMVIPMPKGCNVRETIGSFDDTEKRFVGVDSIERVPHPSRYAHQEMGYLLYSCIKWILYN